MITINNISYILMGIGIIIFIILSYKFGKEKFIDLFSNNRNNYIYPEQLKELCGNGTKPEGQECVPDNDYVAKQLIKQKLIRKDDDGSIVFTPDLNYDENIKEVSKWFYHWTDNGSYSCQKLITKGICNISGNNCNAPCRCGDCAGWRGGNINDCNNKDVGGGRVFCNLTPGEPFTFSGEPDKCECSYGHCAVNGLCVAPYEMSGTMDSKRCCPACAFKSPDKLGGCSGGVKCDPNIQCSEAIVELPGVKFLPDLSNERVVKVSNLCSSITDTRECYHPEHVNAMKKQEYIIIKPNSSNSFSNLCPQDTNTAAGDNEYECALKCGDTNGLYPDKDQTVNNQVECSKRCLPKLWRWYPVFEELSDGSGTRYTGGYYQSDELVRYLSSDVNLRVCPENTCETELNKPIDFTEFHNCTECNQCLYKYSEYKNNNGFQDMQYNCESCKKCILDQVSENGLNYQIACKNMIGCNTCKNSIQEIEGVINECDTCTGAIPDDDNSGCKVYTLDPYVSKDGFIEYHPDSKVYNHGADPYKEYNEVSTGYVPESRNSGCDFGVISFKKTCDNTLNGKIGWGDGYLMSVASCTKTCDD